MKRYFDAFIDDLCAKTGYNHDFLVAMYNECMEDGCSLDYFIGVTLERDW